VINALMLMLATWLGNLVGIGFSIEGGFLSAFLGALVISVVSFILTLLIGDDDKEKKRR
jgi:putative membrane protein